MSKSEQQLKAEYDQVLEFWRWFKAQPLPDTESDGDDPVWMQISQSARQTDRQDKPLLRELLIGGMSYIQNDWKRRRKENELDG